MFRGLCHEYCTVSYLHPMYGGAFLIMANMLRSTFIYLQYGKSCGNCYIGMVFVAYFLIFKSLKLKYNRNFNCGCTLLTPLDTILFGAVDSYCNKTGWMAVTSPSPVFVFFLRPVALFLGIPARRTFDSPPPPPTLQFYVTAPANFLALPPPLTLIPPFSPPPTSTRTSLHLNLHPNYWEFEPPEFLFPSTFFLLFFLSYLPDFPIFLLEAQLCYFHAVAATHCVYGWALWLRVR